MIVFSENALDGAGGDEAAADRKAVKERRSRTIYLHAEGLVVAGQKSLGLELDAEQPRRLLNAVVAAIGLVVTAPIMLLLAIAVKLSSPGPIIYRQTRVGVDRRDPVLPTGNSRRQFDHGGRLFTVYKFRTMVADADRLGQVWACPHDPRVTRVGAWMRKLRLDELPQLVNVLKGDMNLVGPRPEQPEIFAKLRDQLKEYHQRQRVLPGITGWAQVNHHYDQSIDDVRCKLRYDLEYINRQGISEDLRIMLRTIPAVLLKKGGW